MKILRISRAVRQRVRGRTFHKSIDSSAKWINLAQSGVRYCIISEFHGVPIDFSVWNYHHVVPADSMLIRLYVYLSLAPTPISNICCALGPRFKSWPEEWLLWGFRCIPQLLLTNSRISLQITPLLLLFTSIPIHHC